MHLPPGQDPEVLDLEGCGLPRGYYKLSPGEKFAARMASLTAWYDMAHPQIFCSDVEALIRALRLWVEYYLKPDPCNAGVYHYADPDHKYKMVRQAFQPPINPGQPSKTVQHAPRGSTKTVTFIQQLVPMVAITRPSTEVLVSELTAARTMEEMRKVRSQIQENRRIEHDFGGRGKLWPKSRMDGVAWNDSQLDFVHMPGCRIMAHSAGSAMRGRHPILWILDDPERKGDARNPKFRKEFFENLFHDTLPMVGPGGAVVWIATTPDQFSCIEMAMQGKKDISDEDDEEAVLERDERFDSWTKVKIKLATMNSDGTWKSAWEDKHPAEHMDAMIKSMGPAAFEAEMQGNPMASDQFLLDRDPFRHGYMQALDKDNIMWMLDLNTGEKIKWEQFLEESVVYGGMDPADSLAKWATPGAMVFVAYRKGILYVVDAYVRRLHAEKLVERCLAMAQKYEARAVGMEKGAMQNVVLRLARRYMERLRAEGKHVPVLRGVNNAAKAKVARIDACLTPIFAHNEIRLPYIERSDQERANEILRDNGLVQIIRHQHAKSLRKIYEEMDRFTDEAGPDGFDGIDAMEMAIRISGNTRGKRATEPVNPTDAMIDGFAEAGIQIDKGRIPPEYWTEEMLKHNVPIATVDEYGSYDPYD